MTTQLRMTVNDERVRETLREMLDTSGNKVAVAACLQTLGGLAPHVKYLAGPVVAQTHRQAREIPSWLIRAISFDRLNLIFAEIEQGIVGVHATATEMLAYLHPSHALTTDACWDERWRTIYLYVRKQVRSKHGEESDLPWVFHPQNERPLNIADIKLDDTEVGDYERLAGMIRFKVVHNARDSIAGPRIQTQPNTYGHGDNGRTFEALFKHGGY
jgi:hypothetical protein